jgi:DNA-binding SARP family transcriptional activator
MLRFLTLGDLRVSGPQGEVGMTSILTRTCLAALVMSPNRVVSVELLTELLWDSPPASARENLRNHMAATRRVLDATEPGLGRRVTTRRSAFGASGGYQLFVDAGESDAQVFRERFTQARRELRCGNTERAVHLMGSAHRLWRGDPGGDLTRTRAMAARIEVLREERLNATEDYLTARIGIGETTGLVGELLDLTAGHPLRETAVELLMRVLYRSGNVDGALQAFHRHRRAVDEKLGLDPSPRMADLYLRMLRREHELAEFPGRTPAPQLARVPA